MKTLKLGKAIIGVAKTLALLLILTLNLNAQADLSLTLGDPTISPIPSRTINVGQTIEFTAGTGCDADYLVQNMNDVMDQTLYGATSPFLHTFNTTGTFAIQCDCAMGLTTACATSYNISVTTPSTIPTLGEWGLIILGLILASVGLIVLRTSTKTNRETVEL